MKTNLKVNGVVTIKIFNEKSEVIRTIVNKNLVVSGGLEFFVKKIINDPSVSDVNISEIGIGASPIRVTMIDTELQDEDPEFGEILSLELDVNNSIFANATFKDVFTNRIISEIGLFANDEADPEEKTLIARTVLPEDQRFQKQNGQDISIFWEITIG
jgi:hypothetical protein